MFSRDYKDIVGGLILIILGLSFSGYAATHYDIGTFRRMGPGMFPTILGVALAIFGLMQLVPAVTRPGRMPDVRIWSPIFVLAGCAAFAMTLLPFGLMPAVATLTVVSALAELEIKLARLVVLIAALCLISWLIFDVGFGLNVPMFRWPF